MRLKVLSVVVFVLAIALAVPAAAWESGAAAPASLDDPTAMTSTGVSVAAGIAARGSGPAAFSSAAFTSAERLLLRGIPEAIRSTCEPRRSDLPVGTVAAVQCRPAVAVVRDMAYYLLDRGPAGRVFEQRRAEAGVNRSTRCVEGQPAVTYWIGGMPTSELCYRNDERRANLRFLEPATECRQLTVGSRTLEAPTIYVAVLGHDRNIAKLARWATDEGEARPSILTRFIQQPGSAWSDACPR